MDISAITKKNRENSKQKKRENENFDEQTAGDCFVFFSLSPVFPFAVLDAFVAGALEVLTPVKQIVETKIHTHTRTHKRGGYPVQTRFGCVVFFFVFSNTTRSFTLGN